MQYNRVRARDGERMEGLQRAVAQGSENVVSRGP
jgi:hypothetical protein